MKRKGELIVMVEKERKMDMADYDSMPVLSHFKGHPMGGYGGAIKQLSIGCASSERKSWIHSGGFTKDQRIVWEHVAEDPCMKDIGILSSLDPVALDQACMDLIYQSKDPGWEHFLERVESRKGTHTIDAAAELGYGTKEYELICIDEKCTK